MSKNQQTAASIIASLYAPLIGKAVISAGKDGQADSHYTIARLDEKLGSMKDGTKAEYVVLTKDNETGVVLRIHPNSAKKLATQGADGHLKLAAPLTEAEYQAAALNLAAEGDDEPEMSAEDQAAAQAELDAATVAQTDSDVKAVQDLANTGEAIVEGGKPEVAAKPEKAPKGKKAKKEVKADEAPVEAKEPTKKERTIAIYKSMSGSARKDVIAKMKSDLPCSDACANTYYQNVKSGTWA